MGLFEFVFFVAGMPAGAALSFYLALVFGDRHGCGFFAACLIALPVVIGMGLGWVAVFGATPGPPLPTYLLPGFLIGAGWAWYECTSHGP
jgi:hypothetical protein